MLTSEQARKNQERYGYNELAEGKKKSVLQIFLEQFKDFLVIILIIAAVVSGFLGDAESAAVIFVVITMNAVLGTVQTVKAEQSLNGLKKLSAPAAKVVRDGTLVQIPAREVTIGDEVVIEAGDCIPADGQLFSCASLKTDESALTGECLPVEKSLEDVPADAAIGDQTNRVFSGSFVTYGRGTCVVTAIGMETEVGRIARLIKTASEKRTPLQVSLDEFGKKLSVIILVFCGLLFGMNILRGGSAVDAFLFAVALAVAAIPEALSSIVTIVLSFGTQKMAKEHAIVRKLQAVEGLGSVSVICSDKTGTLTQNKMTVTECYLEGKMTGRERFADLFGTWNKGQAPDNAHRHFLLGSILCNDGILSGEEKIGDPTELALLYMARDCGVEIEELRACFPRIREKGFDSERKMMTTVHRDGQGYISYSKGAAERILDGCDRIYAQGRVTVMTQGDRNAVAKVQGSLMKEGRRVMALSMTEDEGMEEKNMIFLGLLSMQDPVRPEAVRAVADFEQAGVSTVMITGDHPDTAFSIARELGIADNPKQCITGRELDHLKEHSFLQRLQELRVFARVTPEHKVRIVEGYRTLGKTVAMTGDGVNDAPSLQAADIGIAMGMNGTDVARGAADFVLMDDNFATIHTAIKEGRGIYENIRKSVLFLLSSNLGEIITMLITIVAGLPSPLKASFILWINLITDSLPALALGVDDNESERLMMERPRKKEDSLFAKGGLLCVICYGLVIGGVSLAAFLKVPYDRIVAEGLPVTLRNVVEGLQISAVLAKAQTHAFTVLGISQLFHAIGMRDVNRSVFKMNHRNNPYMIGAFVVGIALQVAVTEIPPLIMLFGSVRLGLTEWGQLIALSATPLIVHELLVAIGYGARYKEQEETRAAGAVTAGPAMPGGVETGR